MVILASVEYIIDGIYHAAIHQVANCLCAASALGIAQVDAARLTRLREHHVDRIGCSSDQKQNNGCLLTHWQSPVAMDPAGWERVRGKGKRTRTNEMTVVACIPELIKAQS